MEYIAALGLFVVISASPGPAMLLAIHNGVRFGFKTSLFGIIGNTLAIAVMALTSALGMATLLHAFPHVYDTIKIMGGAYLLYLGIKLWLKQPDTPAPNHAPTLPPSVSRTHLLREAFLVGISNPKAIVFFSALFPQLANPSQDGVEPLLIYVCLFVLNSFCVMSTYAKLGALAQRALMHPRVQKRFNRSAGLVLMGFGIALLL